MTTHHRTALLALAATMWVLSGIACTWGLFTTSPRALFLLLPALALAAVASSVALLSRPLATVQEAFNLGYAAGAMDGRRRARPVVVQLRERLRTECGPGSSLN